MCLFNFGGFPRNPVYGCTCIVYQLSGGERVKGLVNRNQIFAFFHLQNTVELLVGGVSL